jgi:hypothetical protein
MTLHPTLARSMARFLALALLPASVAGITLVTATASKPAGATSSCLTGPVQHVIYLQFDNTHFNRDRPNVASDLEQMPHLLNFLTANGTFFTNDHTVLISHTAGGILSSLTGLYPDRQGQTVSNSYDYYPANKLPRFTSSFKYWTNPVDPVLNTLPNMITDGQKNTPAPWVPYTRAGCDFGGVATANIELENANKFATGDVAQVFGNPSDQLTEATNHPGLAQTDFVGIAIHCSQAATSKCAGNPNAKPDNLKDEPRGYVGYNALYGARYVDPAIAGSPCVNDTAGQPITDPDHNCGFPGFDGMLAKNTLGYVEQMQTAGVPITYGYISDAHDIHVPDPASDSYISNANGPGEADFKAQLKTYDDAFAAFFQNLAANGINKSNTLFVVTVDEGDHFAGGIGTPQSDGSLAYSHANCANLAACPVNQIGEVNANINGLLATQFPDATRPGFDIHFDDAPAFYVNGQPGRTDPKVRKLERDVAGLTSLDPYVRDSAGNVQRVSLTAAMADPIEEQALHMINTDPSRTPTFTWFANPDFFFQTFPPSCGGDPCVNPKFAWNHGDIQTEIGSTWVGIVGPGVAQHGIDASTWTDHTNLRPTMLELAGLKDDYLQDGRVLIEGLNTEALPKSLKAHHETLLRLGAAYEQINASFGQFSFDTLKASTRALVSSDESIYGSIENAIGNLTAERDALAGQIKGALNAAAFKGQPLNEQQAKDWIARAKSLLDQANALAAG